MSVITQDVHPSLPIFISSPTPCPYLPDIAERKLFTRLTGDAEKDPGINSALTRAGFRRSHDIVYRPACPSCNACIPVRIPVHDFRPSRSLRRIAARNRDLLLEDAGAKATDEQYEIFMLYQRTRHHDSDMIDMTRADFAALVEQRSVDTAIYQLRAINGPEGRGRLMGAIITDRTQDGFSAVYSFFRPDEPRRSLGAYLILAVLDQAKRRNLPYLYLGYWIAAARKMSYKARFRPLQSLGPCGWTFMDAA